MKSPIVKRSVFVSRHKTSISLEDEFWISLREIAGERRQTVSKLLTDINAERKFANLSSAIRMFVPRHYRELVDQQRIENGAWGLEPASSIEERAH